MSDKNNWAQWLAKWLQRHRIGPGPKPDPKPVPPPPPPPVPVPQPPPGAVNRYRILHDFELPASYGYNGKSRTGSPNWTGNPITPETSRVFGFTGQVKISAAAALLVEKLNSPSNEFNYVTARSGGWVNQGNWPNKVEQLTFAGNFVDVLSIDAARNRAYIRVWKGEDGSGPNDDCVIHHWANIKFDNTVFTGGWHGPAYIVLNYADGVWIPLDKLVEATKIPMK
jgi:hypothetical protein